MTATPDTMKRICIVQPAIEAISETFLQSQAERLPAIVTVVHGDPLRIGDKLVRSQSLVCRALRRARRVANHPTYDSEYTRALLMVFRKCRPDAVLAQYGPTGVHVLEACRRSGIPLVVHFHGYDASSRNVLNQFRDHYRILFNEAKAVIAVSRKMVEALVSLGAPRKIVHWNPCGVDCELFTGAEPSLAPPVFVAVGRFTEKKAPFLTLLAFEQVLRACPEAQLRMIGEGALLGACRDLAIALNIKNAVTFLGAQPPSVVQRELRQARCFVQHSITAASDGDSEGTPVGILEAGASGLPVVSTRHAGIPDVVIEGETGLLVDEHDVGATASAMLRMAQDPELAGQFGRSARTRIRAQYSMDRSISNLWSIIEFCIETE